jgi:NitT/TauT family transport system substrate-binding protein
LLLGALALGLAGCGDAPKAPLALGMNPWVGFDPLVLARDRGLVDGRHVKVVELTSGTEVQRALNNGLLDAAAMTLDETMRLLDAGTDVRIVALLDASDGADVVVARPGIDTVAQLRGEFVAVEDSSVGALLLQRMLQRAGMTRRDIKVVNMESNGHLAALREGRVAAAVSYAPISGPLIEAGYKPVFSSREIQGEIVDVLVVRSDLLAERPDAVDALLRSWAAGLQAFQADPVGASAALARGTDLRPDQYRTLLAELQFVPLRESLLQLAGPGIEIEARAQAVGSALMDMGAIQRMPLLREIVDTGPLQRVLAEEDRP